ncbi:uncharacterized protein PgNI_02866 [Pyricularia grisea]|uniref:Nudix hydrolase domain-containing protein n=1 Tax=Pyricularia grisea TaxID=148305 RepID=A0A6P8BAU3_PYRGI|nr:uncharacterized protein PgNI_02866 [Pyricularia grisea]TLD12951.1 hypothetical protein PgNI_02866 [Pyricularia grisea]
MKFSLLCFALGFASTISGLGEGSSEKENSLRDPKTNKRERCGVVPFGDANKETVWMIWAATEAVGLILPKGGWDTVEDHSWEQCASREAREEGGFLFNHLKYLGYIQGVHWYSGVVTETVERTDKKAKERPKPTLQTAKSAVKHLTGYGDKKDYMLAALQAALSPSFRLV